MIKNMLKINNKGKLSASLIFAVLIFSFLLPHIMDLSIERQDIELGAVRPSFEHLFGTDILGRDLLARVLYGIKVSFWIGLSATAVALIIGVTYGCISGYFGGWVDILMMYIIDTLYTIPFSMFVVILMALFGRNFYLLFLAIGAVEWLTMARIVRGRVLSIKQQDFIASGKVLGFSNTRILIKHILPNTLGIVIVYGSLTIPQVILLEAFLSFLGLGVQPPMCSLGSLIREGVEVMEEYPWLLIIPSVVFISILFLLNILGDALKELLPESKT
ncbi:MAG: ABC transporter permease [Candidatus Hydrogenedentes bacterium]|nr:ABC transporter permease [Candidatus Hydrogenedentota bacterium]